MFRNWMILAAALGASGAAAADVTVAPDGSGDFKTVQPAVDAAASSGAVIRIRPGIYREAIHIGKAHIQLRGTGADPRQVVLSYDLSAGTAGGTGKSASVSAGPPADLCLLILLVYQASFSGKYSAISSL